MDDRITQFRVGVLVVTTAIITMCLIVFFGEFPDLLRRQYTIMIDFDEAPGVTPDTPVRKSGILIGRVTDVMLRDQGGVRVSARIDANRKIGENEICRIAATGLLGDASLEFVPGEQATQPTRFLADGDTLSGVVATSPRDLMNVVMDLAQTVEDLEDDVTRALTSLTQAGTDVSEAANQISSIFGDNQGEFQSIIKKSDLALDNFNSTMESMSGFFGDETLREDFKSAVASFPQVMEDAEETLNAFKTMAERADTNLSNLESFTESVGQRGPTIVEGVEKSIIHLDEVLVSLKQMTDRFDSNRGSLGEFLHNPDLYQNLNRAAENLELLTSRMRPVVENTRIFTDKIAREPSRVFNLGNALRRRPSGNKWR